MRHEPNSTKEPKESKEALDEQSRLFEICVSPSNYGVSPLQRPRVSPKLPSDVRIELTKQAIDINKKKYQNVYRSCCFEIDRRVLELMVQTVIGTGIIIFCAFELSDATCDEAAPYWSLLSGTVGFFLKSSMPKRSEP